MDENYINKRKYWLYQFRLGQEYLLPFLLQSDFDPVHASVLDIGCAEGGVLAALTKAGARGLGIEISPSRLKWAIQFAREERQTIHFIAADFFKSPLQPLAFNLIVLRDVFEHLPQKRMAMKRLVDMMSDTSLLLLTYPPFYSPFGGHQQMLQSFWRRIPYFHILPRPLYQLIRRYIEKFDSNYKFLQEMDNLRQNRLSNAMIKQLCSDCGLEIAHQAQYISRPSYRLRYGWPVIRAGILARIPIINELVVSGVTLLLKKR